ncbi:MAG: HD domain-containing protein [Helicobacteraceae bacterium]|jgi:putative hydrolase of HD superfamily|nr:HD domain-containing protein [Helicobacteraceae bacterium]
MISSELIAFFYNAASIQRWNDYPRLVELTELDKQAHKFIIAFFLASREENINQINLIEAGIFEFLRRVIVTDIRPNVYRRVISEKKKEINEWFLQKFKPFVSDEFFTKIETYFADETTYLNERKLLAAAHYLATRYEFNIVYQSGGFLSDMEDLRRSVESEIANFSHYKGAVEIGLNGDLSKIVDLCGRLRFQIRWSQTPRLPKTSVLGHELIVALFSYFYSTAVNACEKRLVNNFYCALFHDLPEVLTRDIISPVKYSVSGLEHIVSNYEAELINTSIIPLIPDNTKEYFLYLLGLIHEGDRYYKNEFKNRIKNEHMTQTVDDINQFNENRYDPIDGAALKACDHLAAFTEAALSKSYGIRSKELENGFSIKDKYRAPISGVNFGDIMLNFEKYLTISEERS